MFGVLRDAYSNGPNTGWKGLILTLCWRASACHKGTTRGSPAPSQLLAPALPSLGSLPCFSDPEPFPQMGQLCSAVLLGCHFAVIEQSWLPWDLLQLGYERAGEPHKHVPACSSLLPSLWPNPPCQGTGTCSWARSCSTWLGWLFPAAAPAEPLGLGKRSKLIIKNLLSMWNSLLSFALVLGTNVSEQQKQTASKPDLVSPFPAL